MTKLLIQGQCEYCEAQIDGEYTINYNDTVTCPVCRNDAYNWSNEVNGGMAPAVLMLRGDL